MLRAEPVISFGIHSSAATQDKIRPRHCDRIPTVCILGRGYVWGVRTLTFFVSVDGYWTHKEISFLGYLSEGLRVFENDKNKQRQNGVIKVAL